MKNVKICQIKLKEDTPDTDLNKHRKLEMYSPQITSKGRFSYSNNNALVDLFGPQTTTNKNYSSNDKAYSLSNLKKSDFSLKTKQNNQINGNQNKTNLLVSNINNVSSMNKSQVSSPKEIEVLGSENYSSQPTKKGNDKSINIETMKNYNSEKAPETMSVSTYLNAGSNLIPLSINNLKTNFPNYENSKYSIKSMQYIKAYAANTNQGIIRNYNEDRVSIILNIMKPSSYLGKEWPKSSFFAIYDGHGGSACADFLRDNLHQYIIKDSSFPGNPTEAIRNGCEQAEKDFLYQHALNKNQEILDRSGSCAIFALIIEDTCYMANIGDSRGVMSTHNGKKFISLTNDHKPNEEKETKRIIDNGGKVYQTQTNAKNFNLPSNNQVNNNQILLGPHRVFPGRLSVSRTFGDVEAKLSKFGGMTGVIISDPDIIQFKINQDMDYIILGCDGIYDQLTNKEVIDSVWLTFKETSKAKNLHIQCGMSVDMIIKTSLVRRTLDNVTAVMIAFQNFENLFNGQSNSTKIDKNYKSNTVAEQKSTETKKIDVNYNSNKESNSYKLKAKFTEEIDKNDKISKNINTPQNNRSNNIQLSFNNFKKGKDDSCFDLNANLDKNFQSKFHINSKNDDYSMKNNTTDYSDKSNAPKEFFPSTTKNQKSSSFKGEYLNKK